MTLETAFQFVNGYWVGRIGTDALAAVNLCSFSIWILFSMAGAISTGCNAVIAQRIGAGDRAGARSTAWLCVLTALVWGAGISALVRHFATVYLHWQAGHHPAIGPVVAAGSLYLRRVFAWAPVFCLNEVLSSVLRAHGDTRTPLRIYTLGLALDFVLDPVLMFSAGLGLAGAAWASGLSFSFMTGLFLFVLGRRLGWARPRPAVLPQVLRIGLPGSLASASVSFVYILISPTVGSYGPSALAALGIGHRVESFAYLISHGLALASITLVGQHIGAGKRWRARLAAVEACKVVSVATLGCSVVLLLAATPLASIFTDDPEVLSRTTVYLRWMSLSQWSTGISVVLEGVMAGAGRPVLSMAASTFSASLRIPGTAWGSVLFGLNGVWGALVATRALEALLCTLIFFRSPVWGQARLRGGRSRVES